MISRFIVHRHSAGRPHFDLRLIQAELLRSWSLVREPPIRAGEKRLAIERETFAARDVNAKIFREEAFGEGRVTMDQCKCYAASACDKSSRTAPIFSLLMSVSKVSPS